MALRRGRRTIWSLLEENKRRHNWIKDQGMELDSGAAARAFGAGYFNLIRRGDDGSLVLSADRWRLDRLSEDAFEFEAEDAAAPALSLPRSDVRRITWDRLPKQRVRSQLRFHLVSGDLWTFSGRVDEAALPGPG
jgi:hypothetical protein